MKTKWKQPSQNSIDAIAHGMIFADGSEFDVRLTIDGELALHHNAKIELEGAKEGLNPYVEQNHSDDLRAAGFDIFSDLILCTCFLMTRGLPIFLKYIFKAA